MTNFIQPQAINAYIDVVGRVNLTAYATHGSEVVILYMSGAQTSVDATRAKIAGKKQIPAMLDSAVYLVGQRAYRFIKSRDEALYLDHGLLISEAVFAPIPGTDSYTYAFAPLDNTNIRNTYTMTMIGQHIRNLVDVQVIYQWYPYLLEHGMKTRKINSCYSKGCTVFSVLYDKEFWTEAIQTGLKKDLIGFAASTAHRLQDGE